MRGFKNFKGSDASGSSMYSYSMQVVDDRGLSHPQLDQINWCYICHGKVQCILAEQRNGIFSNLTVHFQGTCDDGILLNDFNLEISARSELAGVIAFQA